MRALLAVVSFVMFYVVAAAIVLGLLWAAVAVLGLLDGLSSGRGMIAIVLVAAACVIAAGVVVWSIVPRIDRFVPPGPEITASQHPALFAVIRDVAARTHQATPANVYLMLEANAFVAERGGVMSIGSRRVMGVGLALMQGLTVAELRGVVAHEFGHFDGGDTKLGPWIYKTRGAMARTFLNLQKVGETLEHNVFILVMNIVAKPFGWMTLRYLQISQAVSRQQEFAADRVGARVVGTTAMVSGFTKLPRLGAAAGVFLETELAPLVEHGVVPPVLQGIQQFTAAHHEVLAQLAPEASDSDAADVFDSHPPLVDRIRALQTIAPTGATKIDAADDNVLALTLLNDPESAAHAILEHLAGKPLQRISWDQSGVAIIAKYRQRLQTFRPFFESAKIADIRIDDSTLARLWENSTEIGPVFKLLSNDQTQRMTRPLLNAAFAVALVDAGWAPLNLPGQKLTFSLATRTVEVFTTLEGYLAGTLTATQWLDFWQDLGLPTLPWKNLRTSS